MVVIVRSILITIAICLYFCLLLILLIDFCSHGHMDHISGLPQHVKKRSLYGGKAAQYYVPPHLVDHLKSICSSFSAINENSEALNSAQICGVGPGQKIEVGIIYKC